MKSPTGYIIYKGPSLLDGNNIVVIALTKKSKNSKTGNVIQTYILVDNNKSPFDNILSLEDKSICGNCPHRRGIGGSCYVNPGKGLARVYEAYKNNRYPFDINKVSELATNRIVRLGTYGDPAAVPKSVWEIILKNASGNLGYTHQWKDNKSNHVMQWCMASSDNEYDRKLAQEKGYRTFRIRNENDPILKNEFICPASEETNKRLQCFECKACNGNQNKGKGSPVIIVHGKLKNRFKNLQKKLLTNFRSWCRLYLNCLECL